jgi:VIT1/CCC1 family predicted Fe2+/Mn2+ transporter
LQDGPARSYLRDFLYGAVDGTVTTFAVVSGVAGAGLPPSIVTILGLANLAGDGFSMAASNFLATRAEHQERERARRTEEAHIQRIPEGEREEIRQIFAAKGFQGDALEQVVEVITSDRRQWIDTMLREELGLATSGPSPLRAAAATFAAFFLVGLVPLLAFIYELAAGGGGFNPYPWSGMMTAMTFFLVGAAKGRYVGESWYYSGLETLGVGGSAAALAYVVGLLLRGLAAGG